MKSKSTRKVTLPRHTVSSGNVYSDLDYPNPESMLVKARLIAKITEILDEHGMTQISAARLLGLSQPKLSQMLNGQFRGFSERKLMDYLTSLGRDVQIVVRAGAKRRGKGTLSVVFERGGTVDMKLLRLAQRAPTKLRTSAAEIVRRDRDSR
jgi:predicted XRE-type DNA-binding protein